MERVTFLVERTGERIACLLNPESVIVRRTAGVRRRGSTSGPLSGPELQEDPLLYTGGGSTELQLDLLFDVSLAGTAMTTRDGGNLVTEDVRELTRPIAQLAQGAPGADGRGDAPVVRFLWGKRWNVPGVVSALAERLEYFTSAGAPQRSWLRMRLLRVPDDTNSPELMSGLETTGTEQAPEEAEIPPEQVGAYQVLGDGPQSADEESLPQRPDEIAWLNNFDPALWRAIFSFNFIDDPFSLTPGQVLRIPPHSTGGR